MNSGSSSSPGVLGRGPAFWAVAVFISTAVVVMIVTSGVVERQTSILLTAIPVILAVVMFRAGYKAADGSAGISDGKGEAQKRYIKRTAIFTSLYLAAFALLMFANRELAISNEIKFALALLPGLAICGVFWAIGRLMVEEKDEFLRRLTVRQALIATAITLSAATVWGFLESAELVPHIDAYYWSVAWFFGLFVGAIMNRIQHGTWGSV